MSLHCRIDGRKMTARIVGEVDHHHAKQLMLELERKLEIYYPRELTLDLSGVTFMDSSGVGLALGRYKKTKETRCTLVLAGLNERDKRMMKLSGMQKMEGIEFR